MKTVLNIMVITAFMIASFTVKAQIVPVDEESGKVIYQEVVQQQGTKKGSYYKCIEWFNSYYPNAIDVTKKRDASNGVIEGRAKIRMYKKNKTDTNMPKGVVYYSIRIDLKDGRYRYTLSDFNFKSASKYPIENWLDKERLDYSKENEDYLKQIDKKMKELIESLKKGMAKTNETKTDDW